MTQPKKLIEVAMPVKEISAESVRDKSIRHGHISTLHLWWARRPLPVCRAVVFASLVPDPLDENCPEAFKDAVKELLGKPFALDKGGSEVDWYKPYTDIPYTAAHDMMEDNLRNRLLMFMGKFSEKFVENERKGKTTQPKEQLSDASLIKWESRNNDTIISIARKLIWVAHNSKESKAGAPELLRDFEKQYTAIKEAEKALYGFLDRHIDSHESKQLAVSLENAIEAFLNNMPKVFDPFAGGGAIPLEAARLGCRSFGNDINPVAHIIQKGSLEFPQKYGKPITYSKDEFIRIYGDEAFKDLPVEWKKVDAGETTAVRIPNRLSFDVGYHSKQILHLAEEKIGHLFPKRNGEKPIAYYWARTAYCSNPSCQAEVPLLKSFYLANTEKKQIHLKPVISSKDISFSIERGPYEGEGWIERGNLICPCCSNLTDSKTLKQQFINGKASERLVAIIWPTENGKEYTIPSEDERRAIAEGYINQSVGYIPTAKLPVTYSKAMAFCLWNFNVWGDIFSKRELVVLNSLSDALVDWKLSDKDDDYRRCLKAFLSIWFDRVLSRETTFGIWNTIGENIEHPFGKSAIQMVFDYPESNPFSETGGGALNQLEWVLRYIESEGHSFNHTICVNSASGDKNQFSDKYIDSVVTDPPYYDAVAYADLSDFFYTWLKRNLAVEFPMNFATPQTPKSEECTALKHHHSEDNSKARKHFENKLLEIFDAIKDQTKDTVSIMYAHQSTEAWTTLCNSILGAEMNITGSWAIDTERSSAGLKKNQAFLSSSVTVSCRPLKQEGFASYRDVKRSIEERVKKEVDQLYKLGFRGSDLLTACFGQAVSEFGKYEKVEKADGSEVLVSELLDMAKESAFNALVKGFEADEFTKFYIAWVQLYGFTENDFDDVNRLVKIGLSIETNELFQDKLLIKNGNKQSLAGYEQHIAERPSLGAEVSDPIIDQVHRGMHYFKKNDRPSLLKHIAQVASSPDSVFWRVVNSLVEVLPADKDHDDKKVASELLASKDNLLRDSKQQQQTTTQTSLGI